MSSATTSTSQEAAPAPPTGLRRRALTRLLSLYRATTRPFRRGGSLTATAADQHTAAEPHQPLSPHPSTDSSKARAASSSPSLSPVTAAAPVAPPPPHVRLQQRWSREGVSLSSIRETLVRMPLEQEEWALQQVAERIYECEMRGGEEGDEKEEEGMPVPIALLQHGLQLTSQTHIAERCRIQEPELSTAPPSLTPLSAHLSLYRLLFLHYLDRVATFRTLLQHGAGSTLLHRLSFVYFLFADLVEVACWLAEEEQFSALAWLFYAHQSELWSYRGEILTRIPETTDPEEYMQDLPLPGVSFSEFQGRMERRARDIDQQTEDKWRARVMREREEKEKEEEEQEEEKREDGDEEDEEEDEQKEAVQEKKAAPIPPLPSYLRVLRRERDWVEDEARLQALIQFYQQQASPHDHPSSPPAASSAPLPPPFDPSSLSFKLHTLLLPSTPDVDGTPHAHTDWYVRRIHEIDSRSGAIDKALRLTQFAHGTLHIPDLQPWHQILLDLHHLIYTHRLDHLTLRDYAPLDEFERLLLIMRSTTPRTVIRDLSTKASIFFRRAELGGEEARVEQERREAGDPFALSSATSPLLRRYMLHIAPSRLDLIASIVRSVLTYQRTGRHSSSSPPSSLPQLLSDPADLISLSVECCYYASATDSESDHPDGEEEQDRLSLMSDIVDSMPIESPEDDARLRLLHVALHDLASHLSALHILQRYGQPKPLHFFLTLPPSTPEQQQLSQWGPAAFAHQLAQEERQRRARQSRGRSSRSPSSLESECMDLFERMARKCLKQKSPLVSDEGWWILLGDMHELRNLVFPFIEASRIDSLVVRCTLSQERWELSRELMENMLSNDDDATRLSLSEAERLVLDAAKELFNAAPSIQHRTLKQAEECLRLLPLRVGDSSHKSSADKPSSASSLNHLSTPLLAAEWQREFQLLSGVQRLASMGLTHVVPIEIRMAFEQQNKTQRAGQEDEEEDEDEEEKEEMKRGENGASLPTASPPPILSLLLSSSPRLYTAWQDVLDVLVELGCGSEQQLVAAQLQLAAAAIAEADTRAAINILLQLMEKSPPTDKEHGRVAAQLCYELSQQLSHSSAPSSSQGSTATSPSSSHLASSPSASAPTTSPPLLKAQLHLLSHSMWACTDGQQLAAYLREHQQIAALAAQPRQTLHPDPTSSSRALSNSEDVDEKKEQPSLLPSPSLYLEDDSDSLQTDVERLVMMSFGGAEEGMESLEQSTLPPIMTLASHTSGETAAEEMGQVGEAFSAPAVTSLDSSFLPLLDNACLSDPPLALSYLLSLDDPHAGLRVLDGKLDDQPSPATAAAASRPLSRAQRQEVLDLAMRFAAIRSMLQPHPQPVLKAINSLLAAGGVASSPVDPSGGAPILALHKWELPPLYQLIDCPLEQLQPYVDTLSAAYDACQSSSNDASSYSLSKPSLLLSALHYHSLRVESKKSEYLLQHAPDLDMVRFSSDPAYRRESILNMAKGINTDQQGNVRVEGEDEEGEEEAQASSSSDQSPSSSNLLSIALTLCKRYHLNPWEVYMERTTSLLVHGHVVERIKDRVGSWKEHLLSQPANTYTALVETVWPQLPGTDLPRLGLFIELCIDCFHSIHHAYTRGASSFHTPNKKKGLVLFEKNMSRLMEHKELLDKLTNILRMHKQQGRNTPPFDYKLLLSDPSSCVVELKKLVSEPTLFLVSRLCHKIRHLLLCQQAARRSEEAGQDNRITFSLEEVSPALSTTPPLVGSGSPNVGLFPVLKSTESGVPPTSLASIFKDMPATPEVMEFDNEEEGGGQGGDMPMRLDVVEEGDEEFVRRSIRTIDSSLVFLLFLSSSLRTHIDQIVMTSSTSSSSSINSWFDQYDKLIRRLSLPHLTYFITQMAYTGCEAPFLQGFSTQPQRAELQQRLEAVQVGMRYAQQMVQPEGDRGVEPATGVVRPKPLSSSSSPSISFPFHSRSTSSPSRSVSTDVDLSSVPVLNPEGARRCVDQLVSTHAFLCILGAVFDVNCLQHGDASLWSRLVQSKGRTPELYALFKDIISQVPQGTLIQPKQVQNMIDRIRIQKESAEYSSATLKAQADHEEQLYPWRLPSLLQQVVEEQLYPTRYEFDQSVWQHPKALSSLTRVESFIRLAESSASMQISPLLDAFSAVLKEEHIIQLFQLLLQFLTSPPSELEEGDLDAAAQHLRTQLLLLAQLEQQQQESSSTRSQTDLWQEQVAGSEKLRQQLVQLLHMQLLLIRCSLFSSPATTASALPSLFSTFESGASSALSSGVEQVFSWLDSQPSAPIESLACPLAALLLLRHQSQSGLSSVWRTYLQQLLTRRAWSLLDRLVVSPSFQSVWSTLSAEDAHELYRSLLVAAPSKRTAINFGLACGRETRIPTLTCAHLLKAIQANGQVSPQWADEHTMDLLLRRGYFLRCISQAPLFAALCQRVVQRYQQVDESERRSSVGVGSLPHCLALLSAEQLYTHAASIYAQAHRISQHMQVRPQQILPLIKSLLQQAKAVAQQTAADSSSSGDETQDSLLNTYRAALATLIMDELAG